jgi:hypothetical protein
MCFHGPTGPSRIERKTEWKMGYPSLKRDTSNTDGQMLYRFRSRSWFTPSHFRSHFRLSRKKRKRTGKTVYGCRRNGIYPIRFHPWFGRTRWYS